MKSTSRQYLFGVIFIAVAIYQLVIEDFLEFALYALAGTSFIVNALAMEPRLVNHKKLLVVASWILIGATGILFLYLLQFKYL